MGLLAAQLLMAESTLACNIMVSICVRPAGMM